MHTENDTSELNGDTSPAALESPDTAKRTVSCRVDAQTYAALEDARRFQQKALQRAGIIREAKLADALASALRVGLVEMGVLKLDENANTNAP